MWRSTFSHYSRIFLCQSFLRFYPKMNYLYTYVSIREDKTKPKCQELINAYLAPSYTKYNFYETIIRRYGK